MYGGTESLTLEYECSEFFFFFLARGDIAITFCIPTRERWILLELQPLGGSETE